MRLADRRGFVIAAAAALFAGAPGLAAEAPPDAEILLWAQFWSLQPDGVWVYREKQNVRLNNERAYREFGDRRIAYNGASDAVEVLTAQTRSPDGQVRSIPDYARVASAPRESAWPAYAELRELVLVMPALEPGCVVELEYVVRRQPGRHYHAVDIRLDHRYPVNRRVAQLAMPADRMTPPVVLNMAAGAFQSEARTTDGIASVAITCDRLAANPDDAQAPPWQTRAPRFAFSTAGHGDAWAHLRLALIDGSARQEGVVAEWTAQWTQDAGGGPSDALQAIQEKFAARFNFVDVDPQFLRPEPRVASEVLSTNYGTADEAAAALLAMAREAGAQAQPVVFVDTQTWLASAPQDGMVVSYGLVDERTGELWDPQHGRVQRDGRWGGVTRLWAHRGDDRAAVFEAWSDPVQSAASVSGEVVIAPDLSYGGSVVVRLSGLFVSAPALRTADSQKARAAAVLKGVLPAVSIESITVRTLTPNAFEAELKVKSVAPLENRGGRVLFALPAEFACSESAGMLLSDDRRRWPLRLKGAFQERVDVSVTWPAGWRLAGAPLGAEHRGAWGEASAAWSMKAGDGAASADSRATEDLASGSDGAPAGGAPSANADHAAPGGARFARRITAAARDIAASAYVEWRDAMNDVRRESVRTLVFVVD